MPSSLALQLLVLSSKSLFALRLHTSDFVIHHLTFHHLHQPGHQPLYLPTLHLIEMVIDIVQTTSGAVSTK